MSKKILYFLLAIPTLVLAQSTDQNHIKTTTYKQATTTPISNPDINQANVQVNYFDGLGRPIQQIAHKQSNTGKDIVTYIEYDQFGRQTRDYLPYVSTGASLNYLPSAQSDLLSFYASPDSTNTGNQNFEATLNPFSEKAFESSPLDRVFKQASPGNPWAMGSGKEIKFDYQTNVANEVKYFKVIASWDSNQGLYNPSIVQTGFYAPNQLYKTITKDENWKVFDINNNTTHEFKDKSGKVVLKRTYNNNVAHDTYYIYDQFGNLTYVIPPLAEGDESQTKLDNLGYQYKYDYRNRLVEKKLPGKQWEFIVYDKLDRPIATGPAFSPYGDGSNGWMITQYDAFGRVKQTGWKLMSVNETERKNNQDALNSGGNPFVLSQNEILTKNFYDDYSFPNAPSIPTTLPHSLLPIANNVKGLPTGSWIRVLDDPSGVLSETSYILYDNKYRAVQTNSINYLGGYTQVDTNLDWAGKTIYTITKHKRTNSDTELVVKDMFEYSPQDKLVVHKQQINQLSEQLISSNTYDELGQLISKKVGGTDITGTTSLQKVDYTYNIRGWLKQINDVTDLEAENDLFAFKINYNDYQELGENDLSPTLLYNGNISSTYWITSNSNKLRKYNYSYDNLNRLLEAKYLKPTSNTTPDNYHESMTYDKNGNIQTLLRHGDFDSDGSQLPQIIDELTYTYHPQNKNLLKKVLDNSNNSQGFKDDSIDGINDPEDDYDYDANGNMIIDSNKGITQITYNHLNLPIEITFGLEGKITYLYDATGRKISKQVQNFITSEDNITEYMSGGYQYKNTVLQFFPHAEGYVNASLVEITCITCKPVTVTYTTSYDYVFNYTDHLGNIRLSYTVDPTYGDLKIVEENHYYPFGLKHTNYSATVLLYSKESDGSKALKGIPPAVVEPSYNYKFGNKELQDELGLNVYDYEARNYMPDIGRTTTYDPLAEKFYDFSPQSFFNNNPLRFADPTGMSGEDWVKKGNSWSYVESITTPAQATEAGYDDFRSNGSIVSNARIGSGDYGDVYLGEGGKAHYATAEDYAVANDGRSFGNSFWNGTQGGAYLYSGGFNYNSTYAGLSGNHQFLTASGFNNTGTGYLPLALDFGGSVSGTTGSISGRLGTSNFGVFGNANGSALTLDGSISTGILTGEGSKYGAMLGANAGAYALKGEYSGGFTIGGISMQGTIGGSLASAHIGINMGTNYNASNGTFNINFQENIGLGIGEKGSFSISIPIPFIK